MADGEDPPPDADDGTVLSPEEIDIADDENVVEIEEGRYVVSTGGGPPDVSGGEPEPDSGDLEDLPDDEEPAIEIDDEVVHDWLAEYFEESGSRYGFDVTAKFDDDVVQQAMVSNDVVTIFENLVLWYARHVSADTPVEEVLGILLMEANVPIQYPPQALDALVKEADLSPDDPIEELLAAVSEDGGFSSSPSGR